MRNDPVATQTPPPLIDPETGHTLTEKEGWLHGEIGPLYPVFDGVPIVQPDGLFKMTGLLHRLRMAQAAIATAEEHGPQEVYAPGSARGMEKTHVAHRAAHAEDGGEIFWKLVQHLTRKHPENRRGVCLDIGCGYGFDMQRLCGEFDFVVGLEPQLDRCVTAQRSLREKRIKNFLILCGAGEEIPFPTGTFDLVTANQVVEHVADRPRMFREVQRVLRPGGQFTFALPTRYSLRPEPHVYLLFLGWLPRFLQGPYASLRGRSAHYAEYTNLVSHRQLQRELHGAFRARPEILSAPEAYDPVRPLARKLVGVYRALLKTPLRPLLLEAEGAMAGAVRKRP